ncbi:MAG: hypothetical protein O7C67_19015 [Gammaproteobacteria bacterium]|nr:hypothetical protein [Gammaproteobacteria bacterium]
MINFRGPRALHRRLLVLALLIHGTLACQTQKPPEAEPVTPIIEAPVVDQSQLQTLLDRARFAIGEDHLTFPEEGSAARLYEELLALDPDNDAAKRGLEQIVERYVELALTAADRRQFAQARSMLARARLVDAEHPAIEPTSEQLRLLMHAEREKLLLDKSGLQRRAASVRDSLVTFGTKARHPDCRVTISARNDAEGRWIYQQLSQADGERRIRAKMQLASPPSVELICFQEAS